MFGETEPNVVLGETKPDVVSAVIGTEPDTVGGTHIPRFVDPRTPAERTGAACAP